MTQPASIRSVKGTRDLLPPETALWQRVEEEARKVFHAYNFHEVRTPILEQTALFARSVGTDTDIVTKEMYTFEDHERADLARRRDFIAGLRWEPSDSAHLGALVNTLVDDFSNAMQRGEVPKSSENQQTLDRLQMLLRTLNQPVMRESSPAGADPRADTGRSALYWNQVTEALRALALGDSLTLRPEATASVVRAYIEHALYNEGGIHKFYYLGPMFRRERPQKGRYRQFYQIGAEVLGSDHPSIDAEVLEMLALLLNRVGITEYTLLINSVGCAKCRAEYIKVLRQALEGVKSQMCADCQRRTETNPLRVLDCKVPADQPIIEQLPRIIDYLDAECRQHFEAVKAGLEERGVAYTINPRLVRGLDYYTRTTFEITSNVLGAQNSLLGGGRYDGLSEMIGGPAAPGFGFAIGEDRLVLAAEAAGDMKASTPVEAYIAWLGDAAQGPATRLARDLRQAAIAVEIPYQPLKLKKSMGVANRLGAHFAIIIGEGELESGRYGVKDMTTSEQVEVEPGRVVPYVREKLTLLKAES